MKHKCYSYFYMHGQFPLKHLMNELSDIETGDTWSVGDKKKFGSGFYDYSGWNTIRVEEDGDLACSQFDSLSKIIIGKESIINAIKRDYPIVSCIEIVPQISNNHSMTIIVPNKIMQFCYNTGSKIDVDYYVSNNSTAVQNNECYFRLVCKGQISNDIVSQLSALGVFEFNLEKCADHNSVFKEIELMNIDYNESDTSNAYETINRMIGSVIMIKDNLNAIVMSNNLSIEVEIRAQARNQWSRPLVSPTQSIINLCNALDTGLLISINK